jgi:hypothetical protein
MSSLTTLLTAFVNILSACFTLHPAHVLPPSSLSLSLSLSLTFSFPPSLQQHVIVVADEEKGEEVKVVP